MKKLGTGFLVVIVAGWVALSGIFLLNKLTREVCASAVQKVIPIDNSKPELLMYPIEHFFNQ